jgi:hypothetical protein
MKKEEQLLLPVDVDYGSMSSLSAEIRQKLVKIRPATLGQASRIDGMTPAALGVIRPPAIEDGSRKRSMTVPRVAAQYNVSRITSLTLCFTWQRRINLIGPTIEFNVTSMIQVPPSLKDHNIANGIGHKCGNCQFSTPYDNSKKSAFLREPSAEVSGKCTPAANKTDLSTSVQCPGSCLGTIALTATTADESWRNGPSQGTR